MGSRDGGWPSSHTGMGHAIYGTYLDHRWMSIQLSPMQKIVMKGRKDFTNWSTLRLAWREHLQEILLSILIFLEFSLVVFRSSRNIYAYASCAEVGRWISDIHPWSCLCIADCWKLRSWHMHTWLVVWNMNFIFPYIGNNHPNWLIFFRGVETASQIHMPTTCSGWWFWTVASGRGITTPHSSHIFL